MKMTMPIMKIMIIPVTMVMKMIITTTIIPETFLWWHYSYHTWETHPAQRHVLYPPEIECFCQICIKNEVENVHKFKAELTWRKNSCVILSTQSL